MSMGKLRILPGFYIMIAIGVLMLPLPWLAAWITAAAVHELFHIVFLRILGFAVYSVEIGMSGAKIVTDCRAGMKASLCALAGPLGGAFLIFLIRITPRLALCGAVQSIYNLIPVYPLDGGRAVKEAVEHCFPRTAEKILLCTENSTIILLSSLALYAAWKLELGLFPVVVVAWLILKNKKIPCKEWRLRVQ